MLETFAVFRDVDRVGAGADDRHARRFQRLGELERRLAAVLHDHAERLLDVHDLHDVFERERLEIEAVGGVVVGRDRLRVAVDHDGLEPVFAQRERRMHAAVVELDALADTVGPATEDHDLALVGGPGFALVLVRGIHVRGGRRELRGAGIDPLEHGTDAECATMSAHVRLGNADQLRDAAVGETLALQRAHAGLVERRLAARHDRALFVDDVLDLHQEPRIDARSLVDLGQRQARAERIAHVAETVRARHAQFFEQRIARIVVDQRQRRDRRQAVDAGLEAAQRLLQRLLEGAAHRHDLAHRLHLRREPLVGARELLEREARDLGDDVIDRRLERRRRGAARDVVAQLVERVADGQLRRDLGDREAGGLRRERRRARHARVHLDDEQAAVGGADGELHVRAAAFHADLAQDRDRRVAHQLVFLVRQRLRGRDGDRVARVHAHRIEVLDGADDDAVVRLVADHFHLEFLPADHRFLEQHFAGRGRVEPARDDLLELLAVVGDAAAAAAERERGADDRREADLGLDRQRFLEAVRDARARAIEPDVAHGVAEQFAVLGHVDRFARGGDQFDVVLFEHAFAHQVERAVERRLAAHRGQQRAGALLFDDAGDRAPVDGLDVGRVGHLRVGHDRRRDSS